MKIMFASSGSESEDKNSDIDISVSEESDSAEVSEVSQKTAQKRQMKTSHLGQFAFRTQE